MAIWGRVRRQRVFMDLVGANGAARHCRNQILPLFCLWSRGLVILDEEHDASFKQDEGLVYQARELAFGRIARSGGLAC
jgi:primosomal protein N' (replication factor Y)